MRSIPFVSGSTAGAAWLIIAACAGCEGDGTEELTRQIRTADAAEAQEPDAAPVEDAEPDRVPVQVAPEGTQEAELDAGDEADAATADPDAGAGEQADASEGVIEPGPSTPINYLRPEDSPFAGVDFEYFHLEDFEDHALDAPGLRSVTSPTSSAPDGRLSSTFGAAVIDSVDGDDGVPDDNRCMKPDDVCDAWWGGGTLTFVFDVEVLGALPTHVGGVWTDGLGEVSFEVFGPGGVSIYKVGPLSEPGFPDDTTSSSTGEDRFFGAYHPEGIAAFTISNTQGGVEIDHVQYGRAR